MTSKETKNKKKKIETVTLEELVKSGEKPKYEHLGLKEKPLPKKKPQ